MQYKFGTSILQDRPRFYSGSVSNEALVFKLSTSDCCRLL